MKAKKTLWEQFVESKLRDYKEPMRRGIPRGLAVGPSLMKRKAALLMLTNDSIIEIADNLNISYQVLRNWNSDQAFKNMVEQNCDEFSNFLLNSFQDMESIENPRYDIWDAEIFSDKLRLAIYKKGSELKVTDPIRRFRIFESLVMMDRLMFDNNSTEVQETKIILKKLLSNILHFVRAILSKPKILAKDRKLATEAIYIMIRYLNKPGTEIDQLEA